MSGQVGLGLREALTDRWIVALVVLGVVLRAAYALGYQLAPAGDQIDYLAIGSEFGEWWHSDRAFRTPGYPVFLAAIFELGLGRKSVLVAQAVILSAACYLAAATAARIAGPLAGRSAALVGSVFPPLVTLPSLFLSDCLAAALSAGAVFVLCEGWGRDRWQGWVAVASGLTAAAILVRPNIAVFLAVLLVVAIWGARTIRSRALAALAVVLPMLVLFAPWIGRNYAERGEPTPLGTNRIPFILGVHLPIDMTTGRLGAARRDVHYDLGTGPPGVQPLDAVIDLDPWDLLADNIRHRPLELLEASLFWQRELWIFPFDDRSTYGHPTVIPFPLEVATHYAFLLLAFAGLWLGRHLAPIRMVAAGVAAVALPFFVVLSSPRLAMPAITILLVPVGVGASAAFAAVRRRLTPAPGDGPTPADDRLGPASLGGERREDRP